MPGVVVAQVIPSAVSELLGALSDQQRLKEMAFTRTSNLGERSRNDGRPRAPLIITTENFAQQGRYMLFWAGPDNVQWQFAMRGSEQATKSGTISHYWRDNVRSTFFDEPVITFSFQAGNLLPVRVRQSADITTGPLSSPRTVTFTADVQSLPPGLLDYYEFFDILDDLKMFNDGRPNFVYVIYHSLVYPNIVLRGFFTPDSGVAMTEDAQDPANLKWQATFRARDTYPRFFSGTALYNSWLETLGQNLDITGTPGSDETVPAPTTG